AVSGTVAPSGLYLLNKGFSLFMASPSATKARFLLGKVSISTRTIRLNHGEPFLCWASLYVALKEMPTSRSVPSAAKWRYNWVSLLYSLPFAVSAHVFAFTQSAAHLLPCWARWAIFSLKARRASSGSAGFSASG